MMDSLMAEAGSLVIDIGPYVGFHSLRLKGNRSAISSVPKRCIDLQFAYEPKGIALILDVVAISGQDAIRIPWSRLQSSLRSYQDDIMRPRSSAKAGWVRIFREDRQRAEHHNETIRNLFRGETGFNHHIADGNKNRIQIMDNTARAIVSVLGLLFPRGPAQEWEKLNLPDVLQRPQDTWNAKGQLVFTAKP
jgi:hypothetical protein